MSWSYSFNGTVKDARAHLDKEFPKYQLASPGEGAARDAAKVLIAATLHGGDLEDDLKVDISAFGHEQSDTQPAHVVRRQNLTVKITPLADLK